MVSCGSDGAPSASKASSVLFVFIKVRQIERFLVPSGSPAFRLTRTLTLVSYCNVSPSLPAILTASGSDAARPGIARRKSVQIQAVLLAPEGT